MVTNQAYLFLIFTIDGIIIGILFDIFRILRKSFKTSNIVTYIEDIIFWMLTGVIILYSIFTFNNGEIRLFMFLGILLGIAFYLLLFSKYIIKISVKIIGIIKKAVLFIYKIFEYPIKTIYKIISKPINIIVINISKIFRQINVKDITKSSKIFKKLKK